MSLTQGSAAHLGLSWVAVWIPDSSRPVLLTLPTDLDVGFLLWQALCRAQRMTEAGPYPD